MFSFLVLTLLEGIIMNCKLLYHGTSKKELEIEAGKFYGNHSYGRYAVTLDPNWETRRLEMEKHNLNPDWKIHCSSMSWVDFLPRILSNACISAHVSQSMPIVLVSSVAKLRQYMFDVNRPNTRAPIPYDAFVAIPLSFQGEGAERESLIDSSQVGNPRYKYDSYVDLDELATRLEQELMSQKKFRIPRSYREPTFAWKRNLVDYTIGPL
ncbi:MAG: hypothetical protein A3D39_03520 [Candidatus Buchananbacteria bacterium RIFCSPHIGHO2_02_FULL_39_17]|nr:MAG: hypothetical protein A3D39_03520 [Candidatus Buchananbacteria bacterium RIFCSPHIGHO2_02_FULL_39_17]